MAVKLSSASLLVQGNDARVRCKALDKTNMVRAKQLLKHLVKMFSLPNTKPVFSPEVRSGGSGELDSGDDDVPVDREIRNVFSDSDIGAVQLVSDDVWRYYQRSMASSFSNGPGKLCMHNLGKFLAQCIRGGAGRYESCHSTNAGGSGPAGDKDMQAGSSIVKYVMSKREMRNSSSNEESLPNGKRRFSDVSTYDHEKEIYIAAGEVKSSPDMALSQNLEQMLGLWRAKQTFMLGWTINPANLYMRILVRQDHEITLYNVALPNNANSILLLARLYLAAFLFVDTCSN